MGFTLVGPTSGRIGPGHSVSYSHDLVGPFPSSDRFDISIEEVSTGKLLLGAQTFPMANFVSYTFGTLIPGVSSIRFQSTGVPDGTAVQLRARRLSGGSLIEPLVSTGFQWDPVSNLWWSTYLNVSALVGSGGSNGLILAEIRAAVLHTYSTP